MPSDPDSNPRRDKLRPPPAPTLRKAGSKSGVRDDWAEKMAERRASRENRWQKRDSGGGGCGRCFFKLILFGLFGAAILFVAYRALQERGLLPDWLHVDVPHVSVPWESQDDLPWEGYALADRSHRSPNFYSRNGKDISTVVLHCTESSSAMSAINHFESKASKVSAHYVLERNGVLYQMVSEREQAWHCRGANGHTIGIEIVGLQHQLITGEQTETLVLLLRDLMARHGISRSEITGHDFTPGYTGSTTCPDFLFGGNKPHHLEMWLRKNLDTAL